jgi:hypothetical protein
VTGLIAAMTVGQFFMLFFAILTPISGMVYLVWRFEKSKLHDWQHHACLASLLIMTSVLFLIAAGDVQSFSFEGTSVQLVDQKLNQVKALTEQNRRLAIGMVQLINNVSSGTIDSEGYHSKTAYQLETNLLGTAGCSASEIQSIITTNAIWKH